MKLNTFLKRKPRGFKTKFANSLGISPQFLYQVQLQKRKAPPMLAMKIESLTKGKVSKTDLRPDLYGGIN